jgi:DNA-binding XRE family transcriptional regulator
MSRRQAKHVHRPLTQEERARVVEARRLVEPEADEIRRLARENKRAYDAGLATLQEALQLLKAERLRQGLSLADMQQRTGIERSNLSRLETEAEANPTVTTLTRYAEALGKKLMIVLADQPRSD